MASGSTARGWGLTSTGLPVISEANRPGPRVPGREGVAADDQPDAARHQVIRLGSCRPSSSQVTDWPPGGSARRSRRPPPPAPGRARAGRRPGTPSRTAARWWRAPRWPARRPARAAGRGSPGRPRPAAADRRRASPGSAAVALAIRMSGSVRGIRHVQRDAERRALRGDPVGRGLVQREVLAEVARRRRPCRRRRRSRRTPWGWATRGRPTSSRAR